jgi:hypothetical protein
MKIQRSKAIGKPVSKTMLIRSVASSTAIETGASIKSLETKLKGKSSKLSQH